MKRPSPLSTSRAALATLALALTAGCGDGAEAQKPLDSNKPLYAITTQLLTADEPQSYVIVTDTLEGNGQQSLSRAIELPGRSLGVGIPGTGTLYTAGDEDGTVTRWELKADGSLGQGATVSFANQGVKAIGEYQGNLYFVSATKAYYFDSENAQMIIWNPTAMTVTGSVPLKGLAVEGTALVFSAQPVARGTQVLVPVAWLKVPSRTVYKQLGMVSIDTTTDTATIATDTRCGYAREGVLGTDGQVYVATETYGAAAYRMVGGDTPTPCLVRFDPVALKFDDAFYKELSSLTGGKVTGSILAGPGGKTYLRVLDETVHPVVAGEHPRAVASAPAWNWWQLDLGSVSATPVASLPPSTGSTFLHQAGDKVLFTEFAAGSTGTTLRQLSGEGGQALTHTDGLVFSFLQLR
jgi:hypothetical protein